METINKYKAIIATVVMVLGFGWWLKTIDATASGAAKKTDQLEQSIVLLTQIVKADHSKLEGFLIAMGISPENAKEWSAMPKEPPVDSAGNPIFNEPWVEITEDLQLWEKHLLFLDSADTPQLLIQTLVDLRKKK